jgi:hypothetical protein
MKAMEIDSSGWTDEMRQNAVRKLEELGYERIKSRQIGTLSITVVSSGHFYVYDYNMAFPWDDDLTPTYEQLIAMTKEDVA